jgi:hypothetical protein
MVLDRPNSWYITRSHRHLVISKSCQVLTYTHVLRSGEWCVPSGRNITLGLSNITCKWVIITIPFGYIRKVCVRTRQFNTRISCSDDGEILSGPSQYYGIHHRLSIHNVIRWRRNWNTKNEYFQPSVGLTHTVTWKRIFLSFFIIYEFCFGTPSLKICTNLKVTLKKKAINISACR